MDFFDRQEKAQRNTKLLVIYFSAGVAMLILSIYLVVWFLFGSLGTGHQRRGYENDQPTSNTLWQPSLFLSVAAGTLAVVGLGSLFKTMELSLIHISEPTRPY